MLKFNAKYGGKQISKGSYPLDFRKIGDGEEEFKIFISESVINDIKEFLSSDKEKELGGVILGEVFADENNCKFIIISEFVIALYTESNITKLTFTHSSWEYMNNKIEKEYPDKKIIGWFHSHPGHTVFLSANDKFIHNNFFTESHNVAYVYDPINNDDGFFFQRNNELVKAGCYYIFSQYRFQPDSADITKEEKSVQKKNKSGTLVALIFVLSLLILVISLRISTMYKDIGRKNSEIEELNNKLKQVQEENSKLKINIEALSVSLSNKQDTAFVTENIIKHQVKPGETLRSIAIEYLKDEGKYNLLVRLNNLKDEKDISAGQIIEIPVEK
jgi:proteasome lid subunit RPN8/RPN11/regulator of replication initiation timing